MENHRDVQRDLTALLLSDSLGFLRGNVQLLQALTGLLLTTYVPLMAAMLTKESVPYDILHIVILLAPLVCFIGSLGFLIAKAALYRGTPLVFGDLESAVEAYEVAIKERRALLKAPGILTLLGIVGSVSVLGLYVRG